MGKYQTPSQRQANDDWVSMNPTTSQRRLCKYESNDGNDDEDSNNGNDVNDDDFNDGSDDDGDSNEL